jgi:hypothetical protein
VSSCGGQALARIRFDRADPTRIVTMQPLLEHVGGAIRALAISSDGGVYVCIDNEIARLLEAPPR